MCAKSSGASDSCDSRRLSPAPNCPPLELLRRALAVRRPRRDRRRAEAQAPQRRQAVEPASRWWARCCQRKTLETRARRRRRPQQWPTSRPTCTACGWRSSEQAGDCSRASTLRDRACCTCGTSPAETSGAQPPLATRATSRFGLVRRDWCAAWRSARCSCSCATCSVRVGSRAAANGSRWPATRRASTSGHREPARVPSTSLIRVCRLHPCALTVNWYLFFTNMYLQYSGKIYAVRIHIVRILHLFYA